MLKSCPCCDYVGKLYVRDVKTIRDPRNRKHQITLRTHVCHRCLVGCEKCHGVHTTKEEVLDDHNRTSSRLR